VAGSLVGFVAIYTMLLILFLWFGRRILKKGPDLAEVPEERGGTHRDIERFLPKRKFSRYK
jgi:cytochrome bd-type quinol oxidase subunit 1